MRDQIARAVPGGHEIGFKVTYTGTEYRAAVFAAGGEPQLVYRARPDESSSCLLIGPQFATDGWWIGAQSVRPDVAVYVHQPSGSPLPAAVVLPLDAGSQRQAGRGDLYAIEREFATGVHVYDRSSRQSFRSPSALSSTRPNVAESAVFYIRGDAVGEPQSWVWDRATGEFRQLIDAGSNVVADAHGDETTLAWIETPPYDDVRSVWPPSTICTSPFTTRPEEVVRTARWTGVETPPGVPAAIGGGFYAVARGDGQLIHILRLSDGRRFSLIPPDDEFDSPVVAISYIDEEVLFFKSETTIFRQRIDALGDGEPAE